MVYVLDAPFEERKKLSALGASWNKGRGAWVYPGDNLPEYLKEYLPKEYSWADYQMREGRGNLKPAEDTGSIILRDDQADNVTTLLNAFRAGSPEVLIASKTGTGKTYTGLKLAMSLPNSGKILIVCPKSVIPSWRASIKAMGDHGKRFVIINYESLKKLIKPPKLEGKDAKRAKTKQGERNRKSRINKQHATHGIPYVSWDVIVFDEAHYLANPESQRTQAHNTLVYRSKKTPFVIKMSATIGNNPTKLAHLSRSLQWRLGGQIPSSPVSNESWIEWCKSKGMQIEEGRWGSKWERNQRDLDLIYKLLFGGEHPWAVRADPGWDEVKRYQAPIELDKYEKDAYETAWEEFQKVAKELQKLRDSGKKIDKRELKAKGLAAQIRYRQKVGVLKAPYIAEYIKDLLEGDIQVAVSAEFMATVNSLVENLGSKEVALFTGKNEATREEERQAFQRGDKRVIIFTPSEGFNLHQGETGGNNVPRVQICAEPSWSPIKGKQKEGRTNRDGKNAPLIYPSAIDTIDYSVIKSQMDGFANIDSMMGEDESKMFDISELLGVDVEGLW